MAPLSPLFVLRRLLGNERWRRLHVKAAAGAGMAFVLVLLLGSWIIVPYEARAPRATITSFPLALWWSVETATTVGYGDLYPVTVPGRVIACVVMLVGISVFSVVTASLATWLVGSAAHRARRAAAALGHVEREGRADAARELRALHERFDRLEHLLARSHGHGNGHGPTEDGG
ncbi:potassium channel family protein [Streptomyces paludis]|uniref:Two pore domain potassium channel family protein n=1 Tax=Streptomyces paludis TaxID=2282738 RepID=A0A345HST6_9ACTN|nr:potassium channel family protein [Streptomyces paludis]AXG79760.1 two pore domain potassium channel family protein [Streptomyces paludis]